MAYGRIYIDNLRNKVTALFDELRADNRLCEEKFIEAFKQKYPKDYAMLQYEWEFKVHEFKKKRKGNPKPHPIRPDKILSNMYKNYYFKLVKNPIIKQHKERELELIRIQAGKKGYKIKVGDDGRYNVIHTKTKEIEHENIAFKEVKKLFPLQKNGAKKEEKSNGKSRNKQT